MAVKFSNFYTVVLCALLTFVVVDINKNDSFEKTATAKYLNNVGLTPYITSSIQTIKRSSVYKQYLMPYGDVISRTFQSYFSVVKRESIKYTSQANTWFKKNFASFLDYIEHNVIPVLEENWQRFYESCRYYWTTIYTKTNQMAMVSGDWFNKNVMTKFPQEKFLKIMNEFFASTQKLASRSMEYLGSQVQKIIAF